MVLSDFLRFSCFNFYNVIIKPNQALHGVLRPPGSLELFQEVYDSMCTQIIVDYSNK